MTNEKTAARPARRPAARTSSANGNQGSKWIRRDKRLALYLRDGFCCVYCGRNLRGATAAEYGLDHLNARHEAGHHHAANLATACRSCNSSRQDRPLADFAPGGALDRIRALTCDFDRKAAERALRPFRAQAKELISASTNWTDALTNA